MGSLLLPLAPLLGARAKPVSASALIDDVSRFAKLPMICIWDRRVRPPTHLEIVCTSDIVSS
jgi:hypothetical protein